MLKRTILLLSMLSLIACRDTNKNLAKTTNVLRFNRYDGIKSLDPAFAKTQTNLWMINQLYNGLVSLDDSLRVVPDLAENWTISPDGKTYIFQIRPKVFWHKHKVFGKNQTRELTAYDVEYTFKRLLSKELASPGAWVLEQVNNFSALNTHQFQITLKNAFPPFLQLLANEYAAIVPHEAVNYYGTSFSSNPVGTGPFYCKLWEKNVKLVMRRNPNYFEKDENGIQLPYLEAINVSFLPDKQSEFLQLIQGNIDFITGLDPSYKDELLTLNGNLNPKYKQELSLQKSPFLNTEYLCFYLKHQQAVPKEIRQAINYGFDRTKVIKYLRNNIGLPATGGIIPKGMSSHYANGFTYQPEKAKQLLQHYKKQKGALPEIKLYTTADYVNICEYIQAEMQKMGLTIVVEVTQSSTILQAKSTGKLQFFRASWIADYPDGENYLALFYGPKESPKGSNYSHHADQLYDQLYEKSLRISNQAQRDYIYRQMDSILLQNTPIVPLYYDESTYFVRKQVQNFTINPLGTLSFKRVKKN